MRVRNQRAGFKKPRFGFSDTVFLTVGLLGMHITEVLQQSITIYPKPQTLVLITCKTSDSCSLVIVSPGDIDRLYAHVCMYIYIYIYTYNYIYIYRQIDR